MERGRTNLSEAVRSVQLLKIDGYSATAAMDREECIKSRWSFDGHDWEGGPQSKKCANLSCRLVDPTGNRDPSEESSVYYKFQSPGECPFKVVIMERSKVPSSGYLVNDSLTVECTLTVLKELPDMVVIPATNTEMPPPLPPSDLQRQLGELLEGQRGADVTFVLDSGDRFPAHKTILAARSPVFMAEFFGDMNERTSQTVRIQDMQEDVFKAMLHYIYTDTALELDEEPETGAAMAQHLLAAADRYGLDRLKLICEGKLSTGIDIDTVSTMLALAEQHNCLLLKAKCLDFIVRSPETLQFQAT